MPVVHWERSSSGTGPLIRSFAAMRASSLSSLSSRGPPLLLIYLVSTTLLMTTRRPLTRDRRALGGTRTPNLLIRSQMLYPIELQAPGDVSPPGRPPGSGRSETTTAADPIRPPDPPPDLAVSLTSTGAVRSD